MKSGRLLALLVTAATVVLVAIGTIWPNQSGASVVGREAGVALASSSPEAAVNKLLQQIAARDWESAYSSLANQSEFRLSQFVLDLGGSNGSLRTYAELAGFDTQP